MMRYRLVLAVGVLLAAEVAACGGSSSLPDAAPCPATSPLPTSAATPRVTQGRAYQVALQEQFNQLQDLRAAFKLAHPTNSVSRDSTFRPSVAKFIDDSTCTALALLDFQAPSPQLEQIKAQVDSALEAYVAHLRAGREAVRSRNTTDYHAFWDGLDAKFEAVRASFTRR